MLTTRNAAKSFVHVATLAIVAEIVIAAVMLLAGLYFHASHGSAAVVERDEIRAGACYDALWREIACPDLSTSSAQLPACEYEDGNPDGEPCLWRSDNGRHYYNDGSNYRD